MCGRYALFAAGDELAERFPLPETPRFDARYNIAPTQTVATFQSGEGGRALSFLRWGGLIPSWAADPEIAYKLLNARSETVAEKPSFRSAFKQRRCLISASGFYEWQKQGAGRKQPYFIRPRDGGLFAFAGLWERWHDPQGEVVESCTILTNEANDAMRPIHERMPVIVGADADALWPDASASADALRALFVPCASEGMEAIPVGSWVSNAHNEGPRCLEPTGAECLRRNLLASALPPGRLAVGWRSEFLPPVLPLDDGTFNAPPASSRRSRSRTTATVRPASFPAQRRRLPPAASSCVCSPTGSIHSAGGAWLPSVVERKPIPTRSAGFFIRPVLLKPRQSPRR